MKLHQLPWFVLFAALPLGLGATAAAAQDTPPQSSLQALRISPEAAEAFRLDGLLTEAVWAEAAAITSLIQQEPTEGEAITAKSGWIYVRRPLF